jgi:hypothetical protein
MAMLKIYSRLKTTSGAGNAYGFETRGFNAGNFETGLIKVH